MDPLPAVTMIGWHVQATEVELGLLSRWRRHLLNL